MGKNKRKKKQKEQDFKKVKLKVGKKLPPAPSATETQFKSRAIVLPSQLSSKSSGEPTNKRRQNLKDLISQVNHYSSTVRQDALAGLRNLFQSHPNTLEENLGIVLQRVIEKITDTDGTVRQSLLLLLRYIFPLVPSDKMVPFAPLITAHLSCAMTHIYDEVRLDSLSLLELCLQHFPMLMIANSAMLLPNFIGLISHQSLTPASMKRMKGKPFLGGKDSHVNPKGRMSSEKSKFKVLKQLYEFLKAVQVAKSDKMGMLNKSTLHTQEPQSTSSGQHSAPVAVFGSSTVTCVQVYQHSASEPCLRAGFQLSLDLSSPGLASPDASINDKLANLSNLNDIKNFMQLIMPVLFECWMECNPAQMTTDLPGNTSSQLALSIMTVVVRIIKLVFHFLTVKSLGSTQNVLTVGEGDWLRENYLKDFKQHFVAFFPFATNTEMEKKRKKRGKKKELQSFEDSVDETLTLNILLCEIMSVFVSTQSFQATKPEVWVERLVDFTSEVLESKAKGGVATHQLQADGIQGLLLLVQRVISCAQQMEGDAVELAEKLFNAVFYLYQSSHLMSTVKRILLKFLAESVLSGDQKCGHKSLPRFAEKWFSTLPRLLLQLGNSSPEMSSLVMWVITQTMKQQLNFVDSSVQQCLADFFDPEKGPFVVLEENIQRTAVELLFVLPVIDDKLLRTLVECAHKRSITIPVLEYMLQILFYRSPCYCSNLTMPPAMTVTSYFSFMFSLAVGYSRDELKKYQEIATLEGSRILKFGNNCEVMIVEVEVDKWSHHEKLMKIICQCYKQCTCSENLLMYMRRALRTFLDDVKVFPVIAAYSLLMVVQSWVELSRMAPDGSDQTPVDISQSVELPLTPLAGLVATCILPNNTDRENYVVDNDPQRNVRLALGSQALQFLVQVPSLAEEILNSLQQELPACIASKSLAQDLATIVSKLLSTPDLRSMLVPISSQLEQIVQVILSWDSSTGTQTMHDLAYQYSLFQLDVKRKQGHIV